MKKTEARRQSSTGPGDTEGVQGVWPVAWGGLRARGQVGPRAVNVRGAPSQPPMRWLVWRNKVGPTDG